MNRPLLESHVCISGRTEVRDELRSKRYFVSGSVQGVGFRAFAEYVARRVKIRGYVRNLGDGRVEVYAIGHDAQLGELRLELERGPRGAFVSRVDEEDAPFDERYAESFSIEYDA